MTALLAITVLNVLCLALVVVLAVGRPAARAERAFENCAVPGCQYPGAAAATREDRQ